MSATVEAYAVLVGIPALVGLALLRRLRRGVGIAAVIAAIVLWARGLNVHDASAPLFFILSGIGLGALLRECAALVVRLIRRPGNGSIPGVPSHG